MKQRGAMELINTELINTERIGTERIGTEQQAQTDLDAALARTLRRFIAEVSKPDPPPAPSEARFVERHGNHRERL